MMTEPTLRHADARTIIDLVLTQATCDRRLPALVACAGLRDGNVLAEALWQALLTLPDHTRPILPHPGNQQAPPARSEELVIGLLPALARHPADVALGLAGLEALARLWPAAGSEERPLLRSRWLSQLSTLALGPESLGVDRLRIWTRSLPTIIGSDRPDRAALANLPVASDAEDAFRQISSHLDADFDPGSLGRTLVGVALRLIERRQDDGPMVGVAHGCLALSRMAGLVAGEHLATITAQLAHQLWYVGHALNPRAAFSNPEHLARACSDHDPAAASRLARTLHARDAGHWRSTSERVAETLLLLDPTLALRLAPMLDVSAARGCGPDDAAALATVLAG